jgi:hypothetical protein
LKVHFRAKLLIGMGTLVVHYGGLYSFAQLTNVPAPRSLVLPVTWMQAEVKKSVPEPPISQIPSQIPENIASASPENNAPPPDSDERPIDSIGFNPQTYKTSDELHTRSAPKSEWNIDTEVIPKYTITTLVFTVWVSDTGHIDHYVLDDSLAQTPWAVAALAHLQDTEMEAATLNDQPMASSMTVEIVIDTTP